MRVLSIITLGTLAIMASAKPGVVGPYGHFPGYHYTYGVNDKFTGDFKHATEHREGPITKGSYSVLQPNGVLQTVNYFVDPIGGFQAQVLNKGVGIHPPIYGKGARGPFGYGHHPGGFGHGGFGHGGYGHFG